MAVSHRKETDESLGLHGPKGQEREDQEAAGPKCGRGSATEAGLAVMVIFHPLVKVIIFPTSFSAMPLFRLTGRTTRALTLARRTGVTNKITLRLKLLTTKFPKIPGII
jgi:hypothetical protein